MRGEWTAAAYAALYDRVVDGFAPYETLVDSMASLIERLALADGRLAPFRILDVTCGTGSVVRRLAARGHLVVGVDPVAHYFELAPRAPGVEYRRLEGRRIPADDESFDVVWICLVLGGIVSARELKQTVREIERVLKAGGLVFLVENTAETPDGMYWKYRSVDDYRRLFSSVELKGISEYIDIDQRISVMAGRKR